MWWLTSSGTFACSPCDRDVLCNTDSEVAGLHRVSDCIQHIAVVSVTAVTLSGMPAAGGEHQ